jgi:dephospho-CoA kinase
MITVGLTGGIGMGKSTVSKLIEQRGIALIDTDVIARELVEPGQPALAEITALFGTHLLDESERLQRGELARLVFADGKARAALEGVLHPKIRQRWLAQVDVWRGEDKSLAVIVIPLLFETKAEAELDKTVCVACSTATQRARLIERGWSSAQIDQRLAAQLPVNEKISRADFLLWNEAGVDVLEAQLELALKNFDYSLRAAR